MQDPQIMPCERAFARREGTIRRHESISLTDVPRRTTVHLDLPSVGQAPGQVAPVETDVAIFRRSAAWRWLLGSRARRSASMGTQGGGRRRGPKCPARSAGESCPCRSVLSRTSLLALSPAGRDKGRRAADSSARSSKKSLKRLLRRDSAAWTDQGWIAFPRVDRATQFASEFGLRRCGQDPPATGRNAHVACASRRSL